MNDKECFQWCIFRYLHPADHHPERIRKTDEILADELDFKDVKSPVKIKDIHKIEKEKSIGISVFGYGNKKKTSNLYIKKMSWRQTYWFIINRTKTQKVLCSY